MNAMATMFNGLGVGLFIGGAMAAALGEWSATAAIACLGAAMAMACWYWEKR